jgi:dihydroxyacid dehydratase/phosphogluconate dehydratase
MRPKGLAASKAMEFPCFAGLPDPERVGEQGYVDARTHIERRPLEHGLLEQRLPNRHGTEASDAGLCVAVVAASQGSIDAALHLPDRADECLTFDLFDVGKIFKKTPYVADLKLRGRDVAKDMFEIAILPLLMKTLPDYGLPHQDVVRTAGKPIIATGGVIGLKANLAPEGARMRVAGMSNLRFTGPARRLNSEQDAFDSAKPGDAQILNVKLTDAALAGCQTKWQPGETKPTSGANLTSEVVWKYARQVEPAVNGAVTQGGSHEKQCYADI